MGLTWDSSNHFNTVFVDDGCGSVLFIYRKPEFVEEIMRKLIYVSSNKYEGPTMNQQINAGNYQIDDLSQFNHDQLYMRLEMLKTRTVDEAALYQSDYVLTTDNFLKMNVIFLRIQSKIPVIIMGETGCGKTS